jgi:uncharacterized protein (TIGR02246 family)
MTTRCEMNQQSPNINQSDDEAAIRKVETDLREAWNRHDAKTWANLCAEEADIVNVVGW